ncbi:MAG: NTP transferase domain-containing protein [Proteobacteria bacterium]|nr:NTP transferase domain-containing protein [Pseudomonadota bacterium]
MGRDKLFLEAGRVPLFERVHRVLKEVFDDLIIVANNAEWFDTYDTPVMPDLIPGKGALGGLYTALKCVSTDSVFCFASDMPFLNSRLIRYMIKKSTMGDVIIPRTSDGLQPLHAIYSKACLEPIENLISRGNLKIVDFFTEVNVIYVTEREIRDHDPSLKSFMNVNTEEDLRRAEVLLAQDV